MKTIFDLVSMLIFAAIAVLYLQRSASETPDDVALWKYALPAIGCAVGNYFGNSDQPILGTVILVAAAASSVWLLKPFPLGPRR